MNNKIYNIPAQNVLEKRFSFVKNDVLRVNISLVFRYIIFLIGLLENSKKLPGSIIYSINKDIIISTAAIIESCIHHCVHQYIDKDIIKSENIMSFSWKDKSCKDIYKISDNEKVCGVIKEKESEKFNDKIQFIALNRVAKKAGILSDSLFNEAERVRKKRNRIHLAALKEVDDYYSKKDVKNIFKASKEIIECIELKLKKID